MSERDRFKGEDLGSIARSRKIVELVLSIPHQAHDSGKVVEAVGQVMADLDVLAANQSLAFKLTNGISDTDIAIATKHIEEALALRPADEIADERRELVIVGLKKLRQLCAFNERLTSRPGNGIDGITIFQAGLTPDFVERAVEHVEEVKELILNATKAPEISSETNKIHIIESVAPNPVPNIPVEVNPIEESVNPVFTAPDDEITLQAGRNAANSDIDETKTDTDPKQVPKKSRRKLIKTGGILVASLVTGNMTGIVPAATNWIGNEIEKIESFHKSELKRINDEEKRKHEEWLQNYSLSETPVQIDGWNVSYPAVNENEVFVDIFNGKFNSSGRIDYRYTLPTPIYIPSGEFNPFPILATQVKIPFYIYKSIFSQPLVVIVKKDSSIDMPDPPKGWHIISGRKIPEASEQRAFPNIIQIENVITNSIFYLKLDYIKSNMDDKIVIKYMKKVKNPEVF